MMWVVTAHGEEHGEEAKQKMAQEMMPMSLGPQVSFFLFISLLLTKTDFKY
jgi:hypothetical protein